MKKVKLVCITNPEICEIFYCKTFYPGTHEIGKKLVNKTVVFKVIFNPCSYSEGIKTFERTVSGFDYKIYVEDELIRFPLSNQTKIE